MVIVKLDISNTFGSLCARLVFDVLSGKASRDYARASLKKAKIHSQFINDCFEIFINFDATHM